MRYDPGRKARTRRKIIDSARELFTSRGFDATSIEDIMRACGLTRGGFYQHFASKGELYREAIDDAARRGELLAPRPSEADSAAWISSIFGALSGEPQNDEMLGLAFLVTDAARSESAVRTAYTRAVKVLGESLCRSARGSHPSPEDAALPIAAMLIGAQAVSHSSADPALKARVRSACAAAAQRLLERGATARMQFFWAPAA